MNNLRWKAHVVVAALGLLLASPATADQRGLVIGAQDLDPAALATLMEQVEAARVEHPAVFDRAAAVAATVPALDAQRRGPYAPVRLWLKPLGAEGVLPMLEMLALRAPELDEPLTPTASVALAAGLIEALGSHRDPRSAPVLHAILQSADTRPLVVRAATEALGKLGDDAAAARLIALATAPGPRQEAVLTGLGYCRRLDVAQVLAQELAVATQPRLAKLLVRSLGDIGNRAAWRRATGDEAARGERVRREASQALLRAYLHLEGDVQRTAGSMLLVVGHPDTRANVVAARETATESQVVALDRLLVRLDRQARRAQ